MGEIGKDSTTTAPPQKPTITLPPRPSMDALFATAGGAFGLSPGPMTLMSSFFSPDSEQKSFSQLLAGAMASPTSLFGGLSFTDSEETQSDKPKDGGGFKTSRPMNLVVARSPLFTVPPGLSPSGLLNSPGFFPQSPFGMSHQQALAQVTAQAVFAQSQAGYQQSSSASEEFLPNYSSSTPDEDSHLQILPSNSESEIYMTETSEISHSNRKTYQHSVVDKPADDDYNWRKYGQKPIKGNEYPRSYYKCTLQNCPVKKKVERSSDGQISEIIYKGQHNHDKPQTNKRGKDNSDPNVNSQVKPEVGLHGNVTKIQSHQLVHVQSLESSDSEGADMRTREEDRNDEEPNPKRRNTTGASEGTLPKKTVTEPKIIVQTRSEVDLLDDGYRWRKYGQKVVKGNSHPRSYYKCTSSGCKVRKHVERASADPKAVITTYEGKHSHGLPVARNSGHNNTSHNNDGPHLATQKTAKRQSHKEMDFGNSDQRPVLLQLKEEQIKV